MVKESMKMKAAKVPSPSTVQVWAAQCRDCYKWRKIPTQEEFEEMRSKFIQKPFHCSMMPGVGCSDPSDLQHDPARQTWLAHKPNAPKTPAGFRCRIVPRKNMAGANKLDIYYDPPAGKQLRSPGEVAAFLTANYADFKGLTPDDFCFTRPKVLANPYTPVEPVQPGGPVKKTKVSGEFEFGPTVPVKAEVPGESGGGMFSPLTPEDFTFAGPEMLNEPHIPVEPSASGEFDHSISEDFESSVSWEFEDDDD